MNQDVYAAVMVRAGGRCECCWRFEDLQLDHFFGRAKAAESVENCWALCARCHQRKTDNHPRADLWLSAFIAHCIRNNYAEAQALAETKRATLDAKNLPHLKERP